MTFPRVLPVPRTSISLGTGVECFLAHAGSASMASGLSEGSFPSKVIVPVTDEPAAAAPGQVDNPTNPAIRHNPLAILRMLVRFVIFSFASVVIINLTLRMCRLYNGRRHPGKPLRAS